MMIGYGVVIFLSMYAITSIYAQEYSLGEWSLVGELNLPTTQFYGAMDQETNTAYVTGGLISATQATNLVEAITFDIRDDILAMLSI